MTKQRKLEYCRGCRNDFYNGNNPHGVRACWSLDKAKVVFKKEVHMDQVPPWNQKARRVLSCFHRPRYVYVDAGRSY